MANEKHKCSQFVHLSLVLGLGFVLVEGVQEGTSMSGSGLLHDFGGTKPSLSSLSMNVVAKL